MKTNRAHRASGSGEALLVDERQAAAMLGVSYWTLRGWVAAGLIPTVSPPAPLNPRRALRRKLLSRSDVVAFIERHRSGGAPAREVAASGAA